MNQLMLKLRVALIATLITCVTFVSCNRMQKVVTPAADNMMATDDMTMDMMMDKTMYMSWEHVMLPAPGPAESATSPKERGGVHGLGTRTVYINDIGAVANKEGTAYPAGTMIVKVIMDDANTFIAKKAMMMKKDDPMYANHNGWIYKKYARSDENAEYMQVKGSNLADAANGCHGCHTQADNDSVFVSLSIGDMMTDDGMMDKGMENMEGDAGAAQ